MRYLRTFVYVTRCHKTSLTVAFDQTVQQREKFSTNLIKSDNLRQKHVVAWSAEKWISSNQSKTDKDHKQYLSFSLTGKYQTEVILTRLQKVGSFRGHCTKNKVFHRIFSKGDQIANLATCTEEIFNAKLHVLCSAFNIITAF